MTRDRKLTGREAFNRLFWDPRVNRDAFVVGFSDRLADEGVRETPLARWDPHGSVPWHRVLYIRCGDVVVWSRNDADDRLGRDDLPAGAWVTSPAQPVAGASGPDPDVRPRAVYRFTGQLWQVLASCPSPEPVSRLTVATWNVLADFPDAPDPLPPERLPRIARAVEALQADIVALQEVTAGLLPHLLDRARQHGWYVSEPPDGPNLDPHGLVLLSRFPFTLVEHPFSAHKRVLIGTWTFGERALHLACVHLSSDRRQGAQRHRREELDWLLGYLQSCPGDALVAGDFNLDGDEGSAAIAAAGFADAWLTLRPGQEGATFDPERNPLARASSSSGRRCRFDRLLWRERGSWYRPCEVGLFGNEPAAEEGFLSDHAGLRGVWECETAQAEQVAELGPVHTSALCIIPPEADWPAIQAIRQRFDKQVGRWMPHINLLYGFVPRDHFEQAARRIARALADFPPFEVTLAGYGTFKHRRSSTAWLRPVTDPPGLLNALQERLQSLFPLCDEQSRHEHGFTPHLSVGQFGSADEARAALPEWEQLRFRVDALALIARAEHGPFSVCYRVPLGGGEPVEQARLRTSQAQAGVLECLERVEPALTEAQRRQRETVLAELAEVAAEVAAGAKVHAAGSWRLNVSSPASDLDVICVIPPALEHPAFFRLMRDRLNGRAEKVRLIEDARVPVLKALLRGVVVDVLAARLEGCELPEADRPPAGLDEQSWHAVLACRESDLLLETACRHVPAESYRALVRSVRAWARARQLHGAAWGYLGGFTWAVLAAWACALPGEDRPRRDASTEELLGRFFRVLAGHTWRSPVALTPAGRRYRPRRPRDRLPILTLLEPVANSARNVTRSTASLLRNEWRRAAALVEQIEAGGTGWESLFAPADLRSQSGLFLVLTASGPEEARERVAGQMEGRIVGLMVDLERRFRCSVRSWPGVRRQQESVRVVLGLHVPVRARRQEACAYGRRFLEEIAQGVRGIKLSAELCDRDSRKLPE